MGLGLLEGGWNLHVLSSPLFEIDTILAKTRTKRRSRCESRARIQPSVSLQFFPMRRPLMICFVPCGSMSAQKDSPAIVRVKLSEIEIQNIKREDPSRPGKTHPCSPASHQAPLTTLPSKALSPAAQPRRPRRPRRPRPRQAVGLRPRRSRQTSGSPGRGKKLRIRFQKCKQSTKDSNGKNPSKPHFVLTLYFEPYRMTLIQPFSAS